MTQLDRDILFKLSMPFPPELIEWRPGDTKPVKGDENKPFREQKRVAKPLGYVDPRFYEDRLDEVTGGDWNLFFEPWGDIRLICKLTVHGVTRSSTGEFEEQVPDEEGQTSKKKKAVALGPKAEAQAFKRACSKFGLGSFFYKMELPWELQYLPIEFGRFTKEALGKLNDFYKQWYARWLSVNKHVPAPAPAAASQGSRPTETGDDDTPFSDDDPIPFGINGSGNAPSGDELIDFARKDLGATATKTQNGSGQKKASAPSTGDSEMIEGWRSPLDAKNWAKKNGTAAAAVEAAWTATCHELGGFSTDKKQEAYLLFLGKIRQPA